MPISVIKIPWDARGTFISRPNRFLGMVDITDPKEKRIKMEKVHVHDPGRLKELLFPGNQVLLKKGEGKNRLTKWDVIAGFHDGEWVLVHSGYHSEIAQWVIVNEDVNPFGEIKSVEPEVKFGGSRLDFLLKKKNGKKVWVEVKGCTLAKDGVALFPDAPTKRGRRHMQDLISAKKRGAESAIIMLVFRPETKCFTPNGDTDPEFSRIFKSAVDMGVEVYPMLFQYKGKMVHFLRKIPLCGGSSSH